VKAALELAKCIFASGNPGKLREVREILGKLGVAVVSQAEFGIESVDETAATFVDNALLKARHAASCSGLPAIADDSGLCVDALGGEPGLRSARYAGPSANDAANIRKLLDALRDVPGVKRQAHFHCAAVLVRPRDTGDPLIVEQDWHGLILDSPAGCGGFGYDPVFFDPALGKAASELSPAEKNAVSHRGKALRLLASRLLPAALQ
jgi:XTP/dITP diphosphohydrolase